MARNRQALGVAWDSGPLRDIILRFMKPAANLSGPNLAEWRKPSLTGLSCAPVTGSPIQSGRQDSNLRPSLRDALSKWRKPSLAGLNYSPVNGNKENIITSPELQSTFFSINSRS